MKPSKKKSWKVPKKKSAEAGPNDDDSKDGYRDEKVCVCNNFLFMHKNFLLSVQQSSFDLLIEKYQFLYVQSSTVYCYVESFWIMNNKRTGHLRNPFVVCIGISGYLSGH